MLGIEPVAETAPVPRDPPYLSGLNPVYWQFWIGAVLVAVVMFARGGILGALDRLRAIVTRRRCA